MSASRRFTYIFALTLFAKLRSIRRFEAHLYPSVELIVAAVLCEAPFSSVGLIARLSGPTDVICRICIQTKEVRAAFDQPPFVFGEVLEAISEKFFHFLGVRTEVHGVGEPAGLEGKRALSCLLVYPPLRIVKISH